MKIIIGIQARSGSTRFPGKIYKEVQGKTILRHVYERCLQGMVNNKAVESRVVVLGPHTDEELKKYCDREAMPSTYPICNEGNLLLRYWKAVNEFCAHAIIRVTSDCPLISPTMIREVTEKLQNADYVTNTSPRTFVDGLDCQGMGADALSWYHDKLGEEEHLFYELENNYRMYEQFTEAGFSIQSLVNANKTIPNPHILENKFSVDTKEDLERLEGYVRKMAEPSK